MSIKVIEIMTNRKKGRKLVHKSLSGFYTFLVLSFPLTLIVFPT